jgi:hypothetical protein
MGHILFDWVHYASRRSHICIDEHMLSADMSILGHVCFSQRTENVAQFLIRIYRAVPSKLWISKFRNIVGQPNKQDILFVRSDLKVMQSYCRSGFHIKGWRKKYLYQ